MGKQVRLQMTINEAIGDFEVQNDVLNTLNTTGSKDTLERNLMAIGALETLQKINTIINGTLKVQGFPVQKIQEDVFRYKAIVKIMEEFNAKVGD